MAKLTPKQKRFVDEYLIDLNATQAAIRSGYSEKTARQIGEENLTKPDIRAAIESAQKARAERTEITADMVLQRWWELANADVNELVEYRRDNCRHCWGAGHQYQWTEPEFEQVKREAAEKGDLQPDAGGGFGFVSTREPNPECPECQGEGKGKIHVHDTRRLKGAARRLYRGIHQGKDGLKVLTADQDKALDNVARHLGMFNDKLAITGKDGGPIQQQTQHAATPELLAALKNIIDEV
ncbi:terminase small subunit [Chromobacterium vaccinii]|uniref:terminase small subunit n=1 Tax=Chromobacterium vaccinii TaxID=1108595 RepID=UPI003C782DFA